MALNMCTAIIDCKRFCLCGRTLDLERSYGEKIVATPRGYSFGFENGRKTKRFALIGAACVRNGVPLYYDAINETGLFAAALNFPKSCVYNAERADKENIPSFEVIARVLRCCASLSEAKAMLENANITDTGFDKTLMPSPLHWMIADRSGALCVESVCEGLRIYDDPFGVMTNEPPFSYHIAHITDFMGLCPDYPENTLCPSVTLEAYSRGVGAVGLPGDFSSASRFVRAVFVKNHTKEYAIYAGEDESPEVSRFFHMMDSVAVPYGCVRTENGENVGTLYTSCASADTLSYYFTTYASRRIKCVRLRDVPQDTTTPVTFPLGDMEDIEFISRNAKIRPYFV